MLIRNMKERLCYSRGDRSGYEDNNNKYYRISISISNGMVSKHDYTSVKFTCNPTVDNFKLISCFSIH